MIHTHHNGERRTELYHQTTAQVLLKWVACIHAYLSRQCTNISLQCTVLVGTHRDETDEKAC